MNDVWIVEGHHDYEGFTILAVCESEAIARLFKNEFKSSNVRSYDNIEVTQHQLYTGMNLVLGLQELS